MDKNYGNKIEWVWKQVLLSYLRDREIFAKITITDEELKDAFVKVNEKLAARHLFSATEEESYDLYELIQSGFNFNILAQQVFTDSVLENNRKYPGYFTWCNMDPAVEEVAYSLTINEKSVLVETTYGYTIIKLQDRVSNPMRTEFEFLKKNSHLENVIEVRKIESYEKESINNI